MGAREFPRGRSRLTDRSGSTVTVDLSKAIDIQDVVDSINNAGDANVVASVGGQHGDQLVLDDRSGGSGTLSVPPMWAPPQPPRTWA